MDVINMFTDARQCRDRKLYPFVSTQPTNHITHPSTELYRTEKEKIHKWFFHHNTIVPYWSKLVSGIVFRSPGALLRLFQFHMLSQCWMNWKHLYTYCFLDRPRSGRIDFPLLHLLFFSPQILKSSELRMLPIYVHLVDRLPSRETCKQVKQIDWSPSNKNEFPLNERIHKFPFSPPVVSNILHGINSFDFVHSTTTTTTASVSKSSSSSPSSTAATSSLPRLRPSSTSSLSSSTVPSIPKLVPWWSLSSSSFTFYLIHMTSF